MKAKKKQNEEIDSNEEAAFSAEVDNEIKSEEKEVIETEEAPIEPEPVSEPEPVEVIDEKSLFETLLSGMKSKNKKFIDENNKLTNEVNTLKDRLSKILSEYENFRNRTAKEKEGIYNDACEDILKNIFPVIDNLDRASKMTGSIEDIEKGIQMTLKQFQDGLEKINVVEIVTEGEFNPHNHNAVMHIEDESYGKNQVIEVFQKGYQRENKVLRYSMVKVAN
ncbi:MAG TPA: nucleotide exchange factor GrpE [Clostridiaceae bacterium]